VNRTGLPFKEILVAVAVSVSVRRAAPMLHTPRVAIPFALVVGVAPPIVPLFAATANVIPIPETPFPNPSRTTTDGGIATFESTVAYCPSPAFSAIVAACPGLAPAVNTIGEPVSPETAAVVESVPATVPSFRVAEEKPLASVCGAVGVIDPVPAGTDQPIVTP
jgi:hypothetical protein